MENVLKAEGYCVFLPSARLCSYLREVLCWIKIVPCAECGVQRRGVALGLAGQ